MREEAVERRLSAILVADVVGYSRLMETDETGTLAALKERRKGIVEPLVREHSGRIVKFMGDGVLTEFASAVNAVNCALVIQKKMAEANETLPDPQRILLRIGLNLGDVIGEGSDIYGDGVNVAARLEALAEPGGICMSSKVYDEVKGKLGLAARDLGEQKLKNIATPVRAFLLDVSRNVAAPAGPGQDRPSIAVLPFVNMSGDPEQEYFADGLTEDIITALSRSVRIAVIARTSTFSYKGKANDIKRIAHELDAAFVLEGSVRRSGNRVRITAQLIEGHTGAHLWAEKYDGDLDDVFEIQDQITRSVAASTQTAIMSVLQRSPGALELIRSPAYRLAYAAMTYLYQMTPEGRERAAALSEQALAMDPDCSLAHRTRANAYVLKLSFGGLLHSAENVQRGVDLAREALRRDPDDEFAHWMMSLALAEAGRLEEAVSELDIGLSINPNASMLLGDKGDYLILMGRPEEGAELCATALKLNPRDPIGYWWENSIALSHFLAGRTEQAMEGARRAVLKKPDHIRAVITWAAAAGELGRTDDARDAIGRCLARFPTMNLSNIIPHYHLAFRKPEDNCRLLEGMRKAGLPE